MATLRRWLLLLRVPIALAGIFLFFAFYNRFILNANLQNLRQSLSVLDSATRVGQAEAALLLMDQTLTAQMGREETDVSRLAVLQYAQGTLASEQTRRPVEDAQAMMQIMEEEQAAARSRLLNPLDRLSTGMQKVLQRAALFPRQVLGRAGLPEIDEAQLGEAARLERLGRFQESVGIYEELLRAYPHYSGRATLKLRIGYALQRAKEFVRADRLYREAAKEARTLQEAQTARRMRENLSRIRSTQKKARRIERRLAALKEGPARQETAFKLGTFLIQTYDLQKAPEAFRKAYLANPKGNLALPALFKEGWCLRTAGRLEEALGRFSELSVRDPRGTWGMASSIQIAEIYKAAGDPAAAAAVYEEASARAQDDAMAAFLYASAGCAYLFDLDNPKKAHLLFRDLEKRFPASVFSSIAARIQELQRKKGTLKNVADGLLFLEAPPEKPASKELFSLAEGGPVILWLEEFLPVFVDVFSSRLAKYMHAVGEKKLTRRFSEFEFQDLVVRQVERRFPGQVTEIKTKIHPAGFVGSGNVKLGILKFSVEAVLGITIVEEKPNAIIHEIKVGGLVVPKPLQKLLETRVNKVISLGKYPLKVKQYELREGYAFISVELVE